MDEETDYVSPCDHEMFGVSQDNSSDLPVKCKEEALCKEDNNIRIKTEKMDSNFNEITDSKENIMKVVKIEYAECVNRTTKPAEHNVIRVKKEYDSNEDVFMKKSYNNCDPSVSTGVKIESVSEEDRQDGVDGNESTLKKPRESGRNWTLLLSNVPSDTKPDALKTALEEVVGKKKVSNVRQSWRLQPAIRSFSTKFLVDVSDRKTLKLLVELKPKLRINGQELIIAESKTNEKEMRKRESCIVFISQIPVHACEEAIIRTELEAKVGRGKVFSIRVPSDRSTGLSRGIATAYCANAETAKRLLHFDGKIKISGRKIKLAKYEPKKRENKLVKLSVSNLPANVNGKTFRAEILEVVGEVDFLEIEFPVFNDGTESQNCAFISLTSEKAVKKLLAVHQNLEIEENKVNIHVCHKGGLYSPAPDGEAERRNKDVTGYEQSGKRGSTDNTGQTNHSTGNCFQNSLTSNRVSREYHIRRTCDNASQSSELSRNQSHDSIYRDWMSRGIESVGSSYSYHVYQSWNHQGHRNFSRVGRSQRAYESVHGFGSSNVTQSQSQQRYDNFGRDGWRQSSLASESVGSSDSNNVYQRWDHQGHGNFSRVGWRQRAHESVHGFGSSNVTQSQSQQRYDNCGRDGWRPSSLASESVCSSDSSNVNQGWDHQGYGNVSRVGCRERAYDNCDVNFYQGWDRQSHDGSGRVSRGQRAYEGLYNSSNTWDFNQDWVYQGCDNLSRVDWRQRARDQQGHDNLSEVGWRQSHFESLHGSIDQGLGHRGYGNFNRAIWRPRVSESFAGSNDFSNVAHGNWDLRGSALIELTGPYESVHSRNHSEDVNQSAWEDQGYEWPSDYHNRGRYDFQY